LWVLVKLFVVRNMRQEKFMTLLSVLGVALGIGLFVGVKLASDRALASFESAVQGIHGAANYEIFHPSGIDFDENVYHDVTSVEYRSYPVLTATGTLSATGEHVTVTGIYTPRSLGFLETGGRPGDDLERFYTVANGVIVTKQFAERHALAQGDSFALSLYDKRYALSVVTVVDTDRWPQDTAMMDLGNFQELFGKAGLLSRIDLATDMRTVETLRSIIPPHLTIEKKDTLIHDRKALITSFRYNLQFVSLVAILVGIFLLYNTVFISVIKRRTEIGILRALGIDKKTVICLFATQGLILGMAGSLLGILFGQVTAYFSVAAVKKTISTMYTAVSFSDYLLDTRDASTAIGLGLVISLIASVVPAYEASRVRPHESAREGSFESRYQRFPGYLLWLGVLLVTAGCGLSLFEYRHTPFSFPFLSYCGILMIILGFACSAPSFLQLMLSLLQKPLARLFRAPGKIAVGDMRGSVYRFSIALMSVAISSALIVALVTLIFSFKASLIAWIERTIAADVYVKPASCISNYCFQPLSPEVIAAIERLPEVEAIDRYRVLQIQLFGTRTLAGFGDTAVTRRLRATRYFDRLNDAQMKEIEQHKELAVSEYLGMRLGLKPGDLVALETPAGPEHFTVNNTFMSYSSTSGFVYLDRKWLNAYWGLDDATQLSVYLKKSRDVTAFIERLKRLLLPGYSLEIMNNRELRQKILDIFDRSFSITYAIEIIALFVSVIGVMNTLLALVLEKKREISVIRYLGGSWRQIEGMILISAGIAGIGGVVLGFMMGPLMSVIFVHVINRVSFGWEVSLTIPVHYLAAIAAALCITTIMAGLLPSRVVRRIEPQRFITFE
jgi:putative ABC transport system permease protein